MASMKSWQPNKFRGSKAKGSPYNRAKRAAYQANKFRKSTINYYTKAKTTATKLRRAKEIALSSRLHEKFLAQTLKNHLKEKFPPLTVFLDADETMSIGDLLKTATHMSELIPREGDMDRLSKSNTYAQESRIGLDTGKVYKKLIKLTKGLKEDSQMKLAKGLFKEQTWPCNNSQSSKYKIPDYTNVIDVFSSTSGANRQGVWAPIICGPASATPIVSEARIQTMATMSPILLRMQYYDELRKYLISPDVLTWLSQEENNSADLFYAINSICDTITLSNAHQYLPVDIKVYVLQCKERTKYPPQLDWFDPGAAATESMGLMTNDYVYGGTPTLIHNPITNDGATIYPESSVHLGSTPMYSPSFRNKWEILSLEKQTIMPTDKFQLSLLREFRHCHSIRSMEQEWNELSKGYFLPGDNAVIITFKGKPCFLKYTQEPTLENTPLIREVDASPCKIMMENRSSMNISAPNLYTSSNIPSPRTSPSNYISGIGRVLDTSFNTLDYTDPNWEITVMSNLSEKSGGSR